MRKIPRDYLINIIYTVVGDEFEKWVMQRAKARNDKLNSSNDLLLDFDPEIVKIFESA